LIIYDIVLKMVWKCIPLICLWTQIVYLNLYSEHEKLRRIILWTGCIGQSFSQSVNIQYFIISFCKYSFICSQLFLMSNYKAFLHSLGKLPNHKFPCCILGCSTCLVIVTITNTLVFHFSLRKPRSVSLIMDDHGQTLFPKRNILASGTPK